MTGSSPAENYTGILVKRLKNLYCEYIHELEIIETGLEKPPVKVLETFLSIEQHRFQQISEMERVVRTHLQGCSSVFRSETEFSFGILRLKALEQSRALRFILTERMKEIKTELSSIRVPGRAKNYRQESVPVLIDIER